MSYYGAREIDPVLDSARPYTIDSVIELPANNQKPVRRARVMHMNKAHAFEDGVSVRLEVEGIFKARDAHRGYDPTYGGEIVSPLDRASTLATFTRYATILTIESPPNWKPGDVIDVQFHEGETWYTYPRGNVDWPGDRTRLSDNRVNDLWAKGRVRVVRKK